MCRHEQALHTRSRILPSSRLEKHRCCNNIPAVKQGRRGGERGIYSSCPSMQTAGRIRLVRGIFVFTTSVGLFVSSSSSAKGYEHVATARDDTRRTSRRMLGASVHQSDGRLRLIISQSSCTDRHCLKDHTRLNYRFCLLLHAVHYCMK